MNVLAKEDDKDEDKPTKEKKTPKPQATAPSLVSTNPPSSATSILSPISEESEKTGTLREVIGSVIPIVTIDMILSDDDAASPAAGQIDSLTALFVDKILARNSGDYDFDYSHLVSNVIVSPFNHSRRLEIGYSVKVDGLVYYFDEAPSRQSLSHSLRVYLSFWGQQDLEEHFRRHGLESLVVESIAIDEEPVKFLSDNRDYTGDSHANVGASIHDTTTGGGIVDDMDFSSKVAIACVFVAAVTLIPTAILVLMCMRKRRLQRLEKQKSDESSETASNPNTFCDHINSKVESGDDDDESLSRLMSSDTSTSDDGSFSVPKELTVKLNDDGRHEDLSSSLRVPDV